MWDKTVTMLCHHLIKAFALRARRPGTSWEAWFVSELVSEPVSECVSESMSECEWGRVAQASASLAHQGQLRYNGKMWANRAGGQCSGVWWPVNLNPIYARPAENLASLNEKEEVDLWQAWNDFDPYPLVRTYIIPNAIFRSHARNFVKASHIFGSTKYKCVNTMSLGTIKSS